MPLLTTTAAVAALWATLELVGSILRDEAVKETFKGAFAPFSEVIADWVEQKTGWKNRRRQRAFQKAYQKAESLLINEIGIASAYRVFRIIPREVDRSGQRERLVLAILEEHSDEQERLLEITQHAGQGTLRTEDQNLLRFIRHLRQCLWDTEFRPIIEFYALEEAQAIRGHIHSELRRLSRTVDSELRALRVTLVEPEVDLEAQRQVYLKQIEAFFEEQEFVGFPNLREQRKPTLLRDVYIPLELSYDGGGEELGNELGQFVNTQSKGKE